MLDTKAIAEATAAVVKAHVAALIEPLRASVAALEKRIDALPAPRDGKNADEDAIVARVREEVSAEIKDIRAVVDAIPSAPELPDIAGMVEQAVSDAREQDVAQVQSWMDGVDEKFAALPVPRDGKDADPIDPDMVRSMVAEIVEPMVAAIPQPRDGKDAEPELIKQMVAEAVAELPPAKDGRDAEPIDLDEVRSMVVEIVEPVLAAIPVPQDGKSVSIDDVRPVIEDAVARAVAALPKAKDGEPGKDGVGVAGAVIDRDGSLVVTLSNGDTRQLGRVVGRDGEPGKPGHDGFALKGFEVELMEDGRTLLMKFDDGGPFSFTRELGVPAMIYRGVYREGVYQKGDTVTFGGSLWHSNKDGNTEKPDTGSGAWTLAAKRGRDGKDAA
ncbi:MAG: hypothetical protein WBF99_06395 [Xanthobacteraceae bacterium]